MKRIFLPLIFALFALCLAGCASCASCNRHDEHIFDKKRAESAYLKSEATCTQRAVYYFSCECGIMGGETFEYGELAEHDFKNFVADNNATCSSEATETAKCENCTATYSQTVAGSKLPHTFGDYVSDNNATCTGNCTESAKCENCEAIDTREIPNTILPHVFGDYVADNNATCQRDGTETAKCENCTAKNTRIIEGSKTDHLFEYYESDRNATCTKDCTETAKCRYCTQTDTRTIPDSKLNHSFGLYTSNGDATCSKNCTESAVCQNCPATDTREIPNSKLHHAFETYVSDDNATCDKNCTETAKCEFCDERDVREIPDTKTAHIFKTYVSDDNGTCTQNGTETAKCENCAATDTRMLDDSKRHNFVNYVCADCGEKYVTQGLEYTLSNAKGAYAVTGKGRVEIEETAIYIPATYKGLAVYSIKKGAFDGLFPEKVFIPASVTEIDAEVFGSESLTNIEVDANNQNFSSEGGALYDVDGALLRYPSAKQNARVEIKDGVNRIGEYALRNCRYIKELIIPESVSVIGTGAFIGCKLLENITVDADNQSFKSVDGVLYSKDGSFLYLYPMGRSNSSFDIHDGVTTVFNYAFYSCENLKNVTLPEGVLIIAANTFAYSGITQIEIPSTVKYFGERAFYHCTKLTSVNIPEAVTEINDWAFYGCSSLTEVTIPKGVRTIGKYAFSSCLSLKSLIIGDTVSEIGVSAFVGCTSLEAVYYGWNALGWSAIKINAGNTALNNANVYFYSQSEPAEEGNFWHYGASGEVVIW